MNQANLTTTNSAPSPLVTKTVLPTGEAMEDLMATLYQNFDPYLPAAPEFYRNLDKARGSASLAGTVEQRLRRLRRTSSQAGSGSSGFLRMLFTGHIGGGKSSELLHLYKELYGSGTHAGLRLFPVYLDTAEFMNQSDAALPELLLGIASVVAESLRRPPVSIHLEENYTRGLLRRLADTFTLPINIEKAELGGKIGVPGVPGTEVSAKVNLGWISADTGLRKQVREALSVKTANLLDEINKVLTQARTEISKNNLPFDDIVLLVDNLEKLQRFEGKEAERGLYHLFVESARTLTGIAAHTIYTFPLRVQYAFGAELKNVYASQPFTIPMVAVEKRDRKPTDDEIPYEEGYKCLREMIRERLDGYSDELVFKKDALDYMIQRSGGHIRSLMIFIQDSFANVDVLPVTMKAARQAVGPTLELYSRMVSNKEYDALANLHRHADRHLDPNDPDARKMLEQLMVLEYRNGVDAPTTEEGAEAEPWYAVNPVVRELRGFKAAVERLDKENAKPAQS